MVDLDFSIFGVAHLSSAFRLPVAALQVFFGNLSFRSHFSKRDFSFFEKDLAAPKEALSQQRPDGEIPDFVSETSPFQKARPPNSTEFSQRIQRFF